MHVHRAGFHEHVVSAWHLISVDAVVQSVPAGLVQVGIAVGASVPAGLVHTGSTGFVSTGGSGFVTTGGYVKAPVVGAIVWALAERMHIIAMATIAAAVMVSLGFVC